MPKVPSPSPSSTFAVSDVADLPTSYEAGLQELEKLVGELESGQLPLDQLLNSYQRGAALLAFCRDKLQAVDAQIKILDAGSLKAWSAE
ncbi:MAG: exodeoxyribonuclease VII small subunit [Pseudomonadota bacterium]